MATIGFAAGGRSRLDLAGERTATNRRRFGLAFVEAREGSAIRASDGPAPSRLTCDQVLPTRYQPSMEILAEFIRKHPWWRWLTRTPFSAKMTKYALSSVIAFLLSVIAFPVVYWADGGQTTVASVVAFFAAAIPNWIMNRRWAWQQTGRAPKKQMISYAAVSAM